MTMVGIGSAIPTAESASSRYSAVSANSASSSITRVPSPLRIWVGYDSREHQAWEVCKHSILKHASVPVDVRALRQTDLRRIGLYRRAPGLDGTDCFDGRSFSTEFAFSRFLVPHLCTFEGWALFCDCDFLFRDDVAKLFALAQPNNALMCVHHQYKPIERVKMDGQKQENYPKKNWSSLMLWNCAHPAHLDLTVDDVNTKSGRWLHNFGWIRDTWMLGEIPETWNWLEGHSSNQMNPKAVHFTRGGPWMSGWEDVRYADEWFQAISECAG